MYKSQYIKIFNQCKVNHPDLVKNGNMNLLVRHIENDIEEEFSKKYMASIFKEQWRAMGYGFKTKKAKQVKPQRVYLTEQERDQRIAIQINEHRFKNLDSIKDHPTYMATMYVLSNLYKKYMKNYGTIN